MSIRFTYITLEIYIYDLTYKQFTKIVNFGEVSQSETIKG